jgi:hypothetical protein
MLIHLSFNSNLLCAKHSVSSYSPLSLRQGHAMEPNLLSAGITGRYHHVLFSFHFLTLFNHVFMSFFSAYLKDVIIHRIPSLFSVNKLPWRKSLSLMILNISSSSETPKSTFLVQNSSLTFNIQLSIGHIHLVFSETFGHTPSTSKHLESRSYPAFLFLFHFPQSVDTPGLPVCPSHISSITLLSIFMTKYLVPVFIICHLIYFLISYKLVGLFLPIKKQTPHLVGFSKL